MHKQDARAHAESQVMPYILGEAVYIFYRNGLRTNDHSNACARLFMHGRYIGLADLLHTSC